MLQTLANRAFGIPKVFGGCRGRSADLWRIANNLWHITNNQSATGSNITAFALLGKGAGETKIESPPPPHRIIRKNRHGELNAGYVAAACCVCVVDLVLAPSAEEGFRIPLPPLHSCIYLLVLRLLENCTKHAAAMFLLAPFLLPESPTPEHYCPTCKLAERKIFWCAVFSPQRTREEIILHFDIWK